MSGGKPIEKRENSMTIKDVEWARSQAKRNTSMLNLMIRMGISDGDVEPLQRLGYPDSFIESLKLQSKVNRKA
jgi:hypothetical protein